MINEPNLDHKGPSAALPDRSGCAMHSLISSGTGWQGPHAASGSVKIGRIRHFAIPTIATDVAEISICPAHAISMPDRHDRPLQAEYAPNWDLAAAKAKKNAAGFFAGPTDVSLPFVGTAVDFSRAASVRTAMQAARTYRTARTPRSCRSAKTGPHSTPGSMR
jgi:hypothetical protein